MDNEEFNLAMLKRHEESMSELKRQAHNLEEKLDYWIMAVEAAAVAFAVQQTSGATMNWRMIPLAFAVIAWGFGFFAGYRRQESLIAHVATNYDVLQQMQPGSSKANKELLQEAVNFRKDARWWGRVHFPSFMVGAVFFLAWHVLEMHHRM